MKNKKGFTLIELLAVIVVLAIISLITVPIVLNMIESSRKKAFEDKVLVSYNKIDDYLLENEVEEDELDVLKLDKYFKSGKFIKLEEKTEAYFVTDGTYCAKGPVEKLEISKNCISLDQTKPNIYLEKLSIESNENSVIVTLKEGVAEDIESGIKEYRVSLYDGETIVDTKTINKIETSETVTFNNLDATKNYKIVFSVENGNGITNSVEISLNKPTTHVNPSGWAQSKTVTIIYPAGYTNEYSIDGGTTWSKYENPIKVEDNKTIIARIKNGSYYVTSVTQTVSKIDRSKPTVANVTKKSTTSKSITVIASGIDNESDVYGYQFSKDNGQTWTNVQTSNEYTFDNLSSGTYNIKVKVINNTYSNNGINELNSLVSSTNSISTKEIPTPTYAVSPSGWAQSKTVTINYHDVDTYTHEYSLNGIDWQTYKEPLVFNQNGTVLARITDGTNTVTGYINGSSYTVSSIDTTAPTEASITLLSRTSKSIKVRAAGIDNESEIYGYQFKIENEQWTPIQTNSDYTFDNLTSGTYNIKVKVINGTYSNVGNVNEKNSKESDAVAITTVSINTPTYTVSPSGWAQSKTVTINFQDPDGIYTHYYKKDNGEWQQVTGSTASARNTQEVVFDDNGTLLARVTDGTNTVTGYISGSSYTVSEIDTTPPTCELVVAGYTTENTVTLRANCTDTESKVENYKFTSNSGSDWDDKELTNTITYNTYELSKMKAKVTDGAKNESEVSISESTRNDIYIAIINKFNSNSFLIQHPIGSIYKTIASDENTVEKMATKYGGTWEVYGTDRLLKGTTGTAGQKGGSNTASLVVDNLPEHTHSIPELSGTAANTGSGYTITYNTTSTNNDSTGNQSADHVHSYARSNDNTGSTAITINQMPSHDHRIEAYASAKEASGYGMSTDWGFQNRVLVEVGNNASNALGTSNVGGGQGHTHSIGRTSDNTGGQSANHNHKYTNKYATGISGVAQHSHTVTTTASTTGKAGKASPNSFSVLDPYVTVYIYRRTN